MTIRKVTLSIDDKTFEEFKALKCIKGFSISGWVTSLMAKEVKEYQQGMINQLASGIDIAKTMYAIGMRISIIKEKLIPIYGEDKTANIIKAISE